MLHSSAYNKDNDKYKFDYKKKVQDVNGVEFDVFSESREFTEEQIVKELNDLVACKIEIEGKIAQLQNELSIITEMKKIR
jgi:hypothetical protein